MKKEPLFPIALFFITEKYFKLKLPDPGWIDGDCNFPGQHIIQGSCICCILYQYQPHLVVPRLRGGITVLVLSQSYITYTHFSRYPDIPFSMIRHKTPTLEV